MEYPVALIKDLREALASAREDVKMAAGELLIPMPEVGSDMARVLAANSILRRERDEARALARAWREQWHGAGEVSSNPPWEDHPFPWEPQITEKVLARCEQRAIEIYYSAPPDKRAGDCRAELESEFGEKVVAEMLRIGIGNNKQPK